MCADRVAHRRARNAPSEQPSEKGSLCAPVYAGDGPLKLMLPPRFGDTTWMAAAWKVLSEVGPEGLPVVEVSQSYRQPALHASTKAYMLDLCSVSSAQWFVTVHLLSTQVSRAAVLVAPADCTCTARASMLCQHSVSIHKWLCCCLAVQIVRRITERGYRNMSGSKNPEASVTGALSRDILFTRLGPATYALAVCASQPDAVLVLGSFEGSSNACCTRNCCMLALCHLCSTRCCMEIRGICLIPFCCRTHC